MPVGVGDTVEFEVGVAVGETVGVVVGVNEGAPEGVDVGVAVAEGVGLGDGVVVGVGVGRQLSGPVPLENAGNGPFDASRYKQPRFVGVLWQQLRALNRGPYFSFHACLLVSACPAGII